MVITIDGPAGSGKSTVARKLASRLGFIHLNSGALFRAVALAAAEKGVRLDDEQEVAAVAARLSFRFQLDGSGQTHFLVDGVEMGSESGSRLGTEAVGDMASRIAVLPTVRQVLLEVQRRIATEHSLVVEGRDSGTVVFPDARLKFYLDASLEVRAERRLRETVESRSHSGSAGSDSVDSMREILAKRDHTDSTRSIAPQRIPEGAEVIDTSASTPDQVVEQIVARVR